MSDSNMTYGNLALAYEQPCPSFEVFDGGVSTYVNNAPVIARDPSRLGFLRRHFGSVIFFSVIVVAVTYFGFSFALSQMSFDAALHSTVRSEQTVHSGDTLWQIASEHPISGLDTDQTVQVIRSWNDLDSSGLNVGDVLLVPGH